MRFLLVLIAICGAVLSAAAQQPFPAKQQKSLVQLQISLKQKLFLPGEAIEVEVALLNNSGAPLTFSPEAGWLDFSVWNMVKPTGEGTSVPRIKPVLINETFTVKHTDAARATVDLGPCFDLTRPGLYRVNATVVYPGAQALVTAESVTFNVVPGYKLSEVEFGLPRGDAGTPPESRKYSLQRITFTEPREMRLYVSVTDAAEETIYRQVRLGRVAGNDKPPTQLDRLSNLHVLHQTEARVFTHTVVNPRGELLVRESYESQGSRPSFKVDDEGRVTVSGGVRRARHDDILPLKAESAPAKPAATP